MPKNVLVVGMPRSGTSMTTSIFANNGYFVAENTDKQLRSGDEFNPSGYWEAEPLIKSNVEILNSAGFNFDNTWLFEEITDEQASSIYKVKPFPEHIKLINNFNENSPWVWKDPRLCYTLGYWWPLLNPETTAVLFLKREPKEIYQSFQRLKWRTTSQKDKLDLQQRIEDHLEAAKKAIDKYIIPHITIHYSDFKTAPKETVNKINEFFDLNLTIKDLGYKNKLNNTSINGKINKVINKVGDILSPEIRSKIKKIIPTFIWKIINPNRYS